MHDLHMLHSLAIFEQGLHLFPHITNDLLDHVVLDNACIIQCCDIHPDLSRDAAKCTTSLLLSYSYLYSAISGAKVGG